MSKRVREVAAAFKPKNPYFLSKCTKGNHAVRVLLGSF